MKEVKLNRSCQLSSRKWKSKVKILKVKVINEGGQAFLCQVQTLESKSWNLESENMEIGN